MYNLTKVIPNVFNNAETEYIASIYKHASTNLQVISHDTHKHFKSFVACVASAEHDKGIDVRHVVGQPYTNADDMRQAYHNNKLLEISTDYNDSTLLGEYHNLLFRFAHDCHHCQTSNCNFNLDGEICAFTKFAKYVQPYCDENSLPQYYANIFVTLLFSEIVGQVCYLRHYGKFPVQKVFINTAYFDYANVAMIEYGVL